MKSKPKLDHEARKALALAPSEVYFLWGDIHQYAKAYEIIKKVRDNPLFVFVKEEGGGYDRPRSQVVYFGDRHDQG